MLLTPLAQSNVTSDVASRALHRLMSVELKAEGFDVAEPAAMKLLELEVVACTFTRHLMHRFPSSIRGYF